MIKIVLIISLFITSFTYSMQSKKDNYCKKDTAPLLFRAMQPKLNIVIKVHSSESNKGKTKAYKYKTVNKYKKKSFIERANNKIDRAQLKKEGSLEAIANRKKNAPRPMQP